jgi:hypothetical protein
MMKKDLYLSIIIDIENLGLDAGAHLLIKMGLHSVSVGEEISVVGNYPGWDAQLAAWCRGQGHSLKFSIMNDRLHGIIQRGTAETGRWIGALKTGQSDAKVLGAVADTAPSTWGLAARGATVETGSPEFYFRINKKNEIWADTAAELYTQGVAAQWNPDEAIDWSVPFELPDIVENSVVQVLTYMIENEVAALVVPARFLGQLHPHYREIQALLALQIADEARHIEVFTRRLRLKGREPGLSTAGGQASLKTLLDESDFSVAGFLLSVLGEGTFVTLLNFLQLHAPDPVTKQIARLAGRDESRHVAFGMAHLSWRLEREPEFQVRLAHAIESRNEALTSTSGLNEEVFDALIILAAGEFSAAAIARGYEKVQKLMLDMAEGRQSRLERLGFNKELAKILSSLHTRNFM